MPQLTIGKLLILQAILTITMVIGIAFTSIWVYRTVVDHLKTSCTDHCTGIDQQVASFTIFGCECKNP